MEVVALALGLGPVDDADGAFETAPVDLEARLEEEEVALEPGAVQLVGGVVVLAGIVLVRAGEGRVVAVEPLPERVSAARS